MNKVTAHFLPFLALLWASRAHAHVADARQSALPLNVLLASALGVGSWLYVRGLRGRVQRARPQHVPAKLEASAFFLSMLTLAVALLSPLDRLSDVSFAAHMTQHELLMLLAAPLLVLARPLPVTLFALPRSSREPLLRVLRAPAVVSSFRLLSAPLSALVLHGLVRWVWHVPFLFEAALANEWLHAVQHATFFFSACLFWWGVVQGGYGRAGYGASALFVLITSLHTGALGALLSFAERLWYPTQAAEPTSQLALSDQRLAGLIMWIAAGVWLMLLALALFLAWLGEARRRAARGTLASLLREQTGGAR